MCLLQGTPSTVGLVKYQDNKNLLCLAPQTSLPSTEFQHKTGKYSLWIHCWYNPYWREEDVRNRGRQPQATSAAVEEDGKPSVGKKPTGVYFVEERKTKTTKNAQRGHCRVPNEEEEEEVSTSTDDPLALVASLAACARQNDLHRGCKLHAGIVEKGLFEKNIFVGSALVNMYAKCDAIAKAEEVFNKLQVRNVVSWNALIAGYTQHRYSKEALASFEQMQHEGFSPDAVTFACIFKACGSVQETEKGQYIHAQVLRKGLLETNIVVANALVDMYAKCGLLGKAQVVFDELPVWDLVSWNVLILGYAQHGHAEKAFNSFEWLKAYGFCPDVFTFVCILKVCATVGDAEKGQEIHAELITDGLEQGNMAVGSALVGMYANCDMLANAQDVFEELSARNVVVWTALIEGYVQQGHVEKAFNCYQQMQQENISPDIVTFVCILKACRSVGSLYKGQEIHVEFVKGELQDQDMVVGTALLDMYAHCGMLAEAQEVFDELPVRSVVSWTALIAIYARHGHGEEALNCSKRMQLEGFCPDAATFACILKACASIATSDKGQETHAEIVKKGLLDIDNAVVSALVDMYAKRGLLADAEAVFVNLLVQDVVSWSALVSGYTQHGRANEALNCFELMKSEGYSPDAITFTCILNACGSINAACRGKEIHAEIVRVGLLEKDMVVGTAVVDMYAKCGMLDEAQEVFYKLPVWDVVSWSALITGYTQQMYGEEALNCFEQMELEGFSPNAITFISILKACGSIGAVCKGQKLHAEIIIEGFLEETMFIGTALVDMYANCGMVAEAHEAFDKLPFQNLVSWNALISGYVLLGKNEHAFNIFNKLVGESKEPDGVTFTLLLNVCSNSGLVDMGQVCFETMSTRFGIIPTLEHWTCIVDLFGRAGLLDMAVAVIKEIPILADPTMWHSVLAACQKRGIVNLGQWAFEHAARADQRDGAVYVSMSNIYTVVDGRNNVGRIVTSP